jgi:protein-tyrosine sulfotransferase
MKSWQLSRTINRLSGGLLKYGWWTSTYCSPEAPIILGGCSRSGTTLLREILSAHSQICIGPETAIFTGNRDLDHLARVTKLDYARLRRYYRLSPSLAEFGERVLMELMRNEGKQYWGEKTPSNVRELHTIFRFFPNARFIHILRDGRDVVCSLRTHPKHRWENGQFVRTGIENPWDQCVREWVDDVRLGLSWRGDKRYFEINYESLVNEPENALRPLFSWLGVSWEPAVLEAYKTEEHINHPGLAESIHQKARGRWQVDLPSEARDHFCGEANELLVKLGYEMDDSWVHRQPAACCS